MSLKEADVIIVGGGPVGLTLANELSYRGISTILLERKHNTSTIAKAVGLNSRSMEHYRRLGIHKKIQDASFPRDLQFNIGMYTSVLNGNTNFKQEFGSWGEMAEGNVEKSYPFFDEGASPEVPMFCAQNVSEPLLKDHVEETSQCVTICFGQEVTTLTQNDSGVVVETRSSTPSDTEEPKEYVYKAKYLALCDGGKSSIRKQLGAHFAGQFVIARACSIMFRSLDMYQQMKSEGKAGFSVVSNHEMNGVVITANEKGDFLLHIFLQSTASDEIVEKFVQNPEEAVKFAMGSNLPFTILSRTGYNIHSLVSTKFSEGRCFLAGDSAHQWLPAGGLGMNTGVSDVADLAWKLDATLKGYGGNNLLCSYEEERHPVVDSTRRFAMFLGGNVLFESSLELFVRRLMTTTRLTRYFLGLQIGKVLRPAFSSSNQLVLGFQYTNSSIIMHEYDSNGEIVRHTPTPDRKFSALPGCRAPHVVLADSSSILDIFGKNFVLLIIGGDNTNLEALKEEMTNRKVPFQTYVYPKLPELVAVYDRKFFLVRPDGVICWRSDSQPSTLESQKVIATVLGDTPKKRLPRSVWKTNHPIKSHFSGFLTELLARGSLSFILSSYFQLPFLHSWAVGYCVFWMMRALHTSPPEEYIQDTSRHSAVVVDRFGNAENVLKIDNGHIVSYGPKDVLIRVYAASVDQFDCDMRQGKLPFLKKKDSTSLVLGRNCSGEVVAVGDDVTNFLPGDAVFAAIPQGTCSQLVAVREDLIAFKPSNLDHKEAASLPWIANTVWSSLVDDAALNRYNTRGKSVLISGSGPVSSFAVQLLKAWGANVTVTCATQDIAKAEQATPSRYDIIFDLSKPEAKQTSPTSRGTKYIRINSPEMQLKSKLGPFLGGLAFSWLYRLKVLTNRFLFGSSFYFSKTDPNGDCLREVCGMVERGEVKPEVEAVFAMEEVVDAHKHVETSENSAGTVVLTIP